MPWSFYDVSECVKSFIKFPLQPGRVNVEILSDHHSNHTILRHFVGVSVELPIVNNNHDHDSSEG